MGEDAVGHKIKNGGFSSVRRSSFSQHPGQSDRWISTEQEGKTLYAEQATRGPRICEF